MSQVQDERFQFVERLGTGRFGEVWLAQERTRGGLARLVAVKILREQYEETSDAVKRLKDEGQILAMLAHPSIVTVHETTRIQGRLALVTEYIEGIDVEKFCTPGKVLPARVAVGVIARVASALDWALHTPNPSTGKPLNLIHRDIKPANIRLSTFGEVKLLDFGLARSTEMKRQAMTQVGHVLGTPGYAAPEALAFQVSSPAGDVYALACTLYQMLRGEKLFEGMPLEDQAMLALDTVDYAKHLAKRMQKIEHPDLRVLLSEMLAHSPEKRPTAANVCEVCEDQARQMTGPTYQQWAREHADKALQADRPKEGKASKGGGGRGGVSSSQILLGVAIVASLFLVCFGFGTLAAAMWWVLG